MSAAVCLQLCAGPVQEMELDCSSAGGTGLPRNWDGVRWDLIESGGFEEDGVGWGAVGRNESVNPAEAS